MGIPQADIGSWEQIEKRIKEGFADAVYGAVVVEYKAPGLLREENAYNENQKAIKQTQDYLNDLMDIYNWPSSMLSGIVTDGLKIINIPVGKHPPEPFDVSSESLRQFLKRFHLLSQEEPFHADRIRDYFGGGTNLTKMVVESLFQAFQNRSSEQADTYYKQWKYMFSISHGSTEEKYLNELEKSVGIEPESEEEAMELLFCLYTYVVLVVKMIASNLVSFYSGYELQTTSLISVKGEDLLEEFKKLEEAKLFERKGIKNFTEGNFFSWYLHEWTEIETSMLELVGTVGKFNPQSLADNPEETADLLKGLYQDLVPRKLRHRLGEFYTPDWLAEQTCNLTDYNGHPEDRVLDPGCGSGTFLIKAIEKVKKYLDKHRLNQTDPDKVIYGKKILNNIVGFDLNPVAVLAARTNYLLALGDLLETLIKSDETIDLPVFLCDSILTPKLQKQLSLGLQSGDTEIDSRAVPQDSDLRAYEIWTAEKEFQVPISTVKANEIRELANIVERSIKDKQSEEEFWNQVKQELKTANSETESIMRRLYKDTWELAEKERDDIWPRIIKNAFAQMMQEPFDYVIGNPPWVNWENLPRKWRESSKFLWQKYGLFTLEGHEARLGGGKKDLSMLFTYVCSNNYLEQGGKIGFVITQTLFKTTGAGDGFRRFQLGEKDYLKVEHVDDMVELKPFEGASNRTAIVVLTKGEQTKYPVPYTLWQKVKRGRVPEETPLKEIKEDWGKTTDFLAKPVNSDINTSPWITARPEALSALQKIFGKSDYQAREGANTGGLNGGYVLEIIRKRSDGLLVIRNLPDAGRKEVSQIQSAIEPDLVYPLLKGRNIKRWEAKPKKCLLVTQNPENRIGWSEEKMKAEWPHTYNYLKQLEEPLRNRSLYKKYFKSTDPFWSMYGVGPYIMAPYKVGWTRVATDITATFFNKANVFESKEKLIIPIETVCFVPFEDKAHAHYFGALINCSPVRLFIKSYSSQSTGSFGSPHILRNTLIPKFQEQNKMHWRLSSLSQRAHRYAMSGENGKLKKAEQEIDQTAAQLWGINNHELEDIYRSLEELK